MGVTFYTSLSEISIYNWTMLAETADINYLVKEGVYHKDNYDQAIKIFNKLQQDYIDLFGVNGDSEYLMILLKRSIKLKSELLLGGQRSLINQINILKLEIDSLLKQQDENGNISIDEQLISMSKFLGYGIKSKETTVTEFKATINVIDKWQSNQSKAVK